LRERSTARRAFWSGTITFGLVSVPVELFAGVRPRPTGMRMVDAKGRPLGRRYYCPKEDKALTDEEIVRGFETTAGKTIVITDEDLESVAPGMTRDIELRAFVPQEQVAALYYQRPYFLAPPGGSTRAYHLLAETMQRTGRVGIGSLVMRGHEYLVAILADNGVLRAQTLRYADELRTPEDIGLPKRAKIAKKRTGQFIKAIASLTRKELDIDELSDRYADKIEALAQSKRKKDEDVIDATALESDDDEAPGAQVIDLMKILRQRLDAHVAPAADAHALPRRTSASKHRRKRAGPKKAGRRPVRQDDLESLSKHDLMKQAQSLHVPGRSKMAKKALIKAIQQAA
jgi:DNA end-binding protein Ku